MGAVINGVELFDLQGSGIKTFSRSLCRAVQEFMPGDTSILVQVSGQKGESMLADSNVFQVHEETTRRTLVPKVKLLLQEKARQALWRGPVRTKVSAVSGRDPMLATALQRLPAGNPAAAGGHWRAQPSSLPSFYYGAQLFQRAKERFLISRKPTWIRFPRLTASDSAPIIFHNPMPFPLLAEGKVNVTTVHDLIALTHPELCLDNPAEVFSLLSQTIDHSDAIHAISQYTADTLLGIFGERLRPKLRVISQPTPTPPSDEARQQEVIGRSLAAFDQLHAGGDGYLLQLGTIEPKKNHATTLEVFRELRKRYPGLRLVVIGKQGWLCREICEALGSAASDGVTWMGSVPRQAVTNHLLDALVLLFPSIVEGWGLPPVEAMARGTPVVASGIAACREACGDAATYVADPMDSGGFRDAVLTLLEDRERYLAAVRNGLAQARRHSDARFGAGLEAMYRALG
jgi:glycosyltransferase involved in cell wall biosynthesis